MVHLLGHLVALLAALVDGAWCEVLQIAHQRRRVRLCHHLRGCTDDACSTCIGLETTLMTAAALTPAVHHAGMSELTSIAKVPLMIFAFGEETTTQTDAQTDDDEVLHTMGTAEGVFTQR